ncbi:MAG: pilus assembly protein FimV [Halioglobus sp.]|jgi:pilus assembly protein FimV
MARRIATGLVTLGLFYSSAVSSLGLGELTLESFLNEPFKANVDLLNTGGLADHQIRIRLATADDFERLGVDRAYFLTDIDFEIEIDEAGNGRILMSSEGPVLEPYLDFIIEARWPSGRLLREYTVLVDPPVFDEASSIIVSARNQADQASAATESKKKSRASNGDQLAVNKSRLADGAMPERDFGSDASAAPIAGDKYMIQRDETLWSIAKRAMPAGSSVHQTMLDIQRLNPKAFLGGNINRIKAGYIIYLPTAGDLSSDNFAEALAAVRDQNQDWRDGVNSTSNSSRSSLRISTESELDTDSSESRDSSADEASIASATGAGAGDNSAAREGNSSERVGALAQQIDTLERIVSLKDDQIAALQNALAEANAAAAQVGTADSSVDGMDEPATLEVEPAVDDMLPSSGESMSEVDSSLEEKVTETPARAELAAPVPATASIPASDTDSQTGFFSGWLIYVIGLLLAVVAAGAFIWQRRRDASQEEDAPVSDDVYADIELEDESLELDTQPELKPESDVDVEDEVAEVNDNRPVVASRDRGYGQRKNDQYAADMDAGDALAEADIYIAYGRYPQAVDLLKTAISGEPDNANYKLKLLQVSADVGNQGEAMTQLAALNALGDAGSIARAEDYLREIERKAVADATPVLNDDPGHELGDELELPELDMMDDDEILNLEDDFGELEIEPSDAESIEDELDLSADFDEQAIALPVDDEDMVFAADGDAMSTKLDLARAYMDMGDQDGARQIFEEVVAGGTDTQREEARSLIESLD